MLRGKSSLTASPGADFQGLCAAAAARLWLLPSESSPLEVLGSRPGEAVPPLLSLPCGWLKGADLAAVCGVFRLLTLKTFL